MLKLLVVDDEPFVRAGIKKTVENMRNWRVLGEAGNGNEAIAMVMRELPDLILCDIRMPECDGIEFMKRLRSEGYEIPLIFLTGHPDFAYAQEALRYGALDYLLKPCLAKDICAALEKAELELIEQSIQKKHALSTMEKAIRGLLYGGENPERFDLSHFVWLGAGHHYNIISLHVASQNTDDSGLIAEGVKKVLQDLQHILLKDGPYEYVLVMENGGDVDRENIMQTADLIRRNSEIALWLGIGNRVELNKLNQSYMQSKIALRLTNENKPIIEYADLTTLGAIPVAMTIEWEMSLLQAVKNGNVEEAVVYINQLRESFIHLPVQEMSHHLYELYMQLLSGAELLSDNSELFSPLMLLEGTERNAMITKFTDQVRNICIKVQQQQSLETNYLVNRAIQLIHAKFKENITLKEIAVQLYLSPAYLSVLFKQETGQTFSDYLIDCRMNEAKRLLQDPTYKVYEVAQNIGYVDGRHFSQVFKSCTGHTPQEFRNRNYISGN